MKEEAIEVLEMMEAEIEVLGVIAETELREGREFH
jgi:hypothetical protein